MALLISAKVYAQNWNIDFTGSIYDNWASAKNVILDDSIAYCATDETGLKVLDVSNLDAIRQISAYPTSGNCSRLFKSGDYLFVTDHSDTMMILDVSDPANPFPEGVIFVQGANFYGCYTEGNYAYLADYTYGLRIFDVADPSLPVQVSSCELNGSMYDVVKYDNYVFVSAHNSGLHSIDVSDPAHPILADTYQAEHMIIDLALQGNYLYVTLGNYGDMQVLNISEPTYMLYCGAYSIESGAGGILVEGNYAYLTQSNYGIHIIDISNPGLPLYCSYTDLPGQSGGMAKDGDLLYIASGDAGIVILDVSVPQQPSIVYSYTNNDLMTSVVEGNFAYIANGEFGVKIVNISDPSNPVETAAISITGYIKDVAVEGNILCAGDYQSGGIWIYDISDPYNPQEITFFFTGPFINRVEMEGNTVYIGASDFFIVDISDPYDPGILDSFHPYWTIEDFRIQGDYAYIATGVKALQFLDISNPNNIHLAGEFDFHTGVVSSLEVYNNYAYVVNCSHFYIFDVSNFAQPVLLDTISSLDNTKYMARHYEYLHIVSVNNGLYIYDISDPLNLVVTGYNYYPNSPKHVTACGEYAFVVDNYHYEIFNCEEAVGIKNIGNGDIPAAFALANPYPNPFNNETTITYTLPQDGEVSLKVFDLQGREVAALGTGHQALGTHSVTWDAEGAASGVYFIRLTVDGGQSSVRKVVLMK